MKLIKDKTATLLRAANRYQDGWDVDDDGDRMYRGEMGFGGTGYSGMGCGEMSHDKELWCADACERLVGGRMRGSEHRQLKT